MEKNKRNKKTKLVLLPEVAKVTSIALLQKHGIPNERFLKKIKQSAL